MEVFKLHFSKEIDCSPDVALWNYWDHEHINIVHDSFTDAKVMYEDEKLAILLLTFKIPIFSFLKNTGMSAFVKHGKYHFSDFQMLQFGIPFCSTIKITGIDDDRCKITMDYRYYLKGWKRIIFKPLLKVMAGRWNEAFWLEDLNLKLRRQRVVRWGFKDFVGMPDDLKDRINDQPLDQKTPVRRPKGSPLDEFRITDI